MLVDDIVDAASMLVRSLEMNATQSESNTTVNCIENFTARIFGML